MLDLISTYDILNVIYCQEISSVITNSPNLGAEAGGEEDDGQDEPGGAGQVGGY